MRTYVRIEARKLQHWRGDALGLTEGRSERREGAFPGLDVERVRTFDAPEALGINFHEVRAKSALNKVPGDYLPFNWTVNAFRGCAHACVYCFARNTHTYLDLDAGRDFEREIVVKVNVPELLRAELARPSWKRELVAFGTNTDPYQWAEGKYELMPPMIEALRETETPTSILTKSPLVTARPRPLPRARRGRGCLASTSRCRRSTRRSGAQTEPHTPHPRKRLEAVATFNEAGIPSGRPGRPADAGDQRLAGAGRGDRLDRRGGGGDLRQRHRPAPAAGGEGGLHVLALRGSP